VPPKARLPAVTIARQIAERFRHDAVLVVGLGLALLVLVFEPLQRFFVFIRDLELQTGTAMLPAAVVLLSALMLHQQRKRHLVTLEGRAVAATLAAAGERARDLERLVAFGHATANALDFHALREATQAHLVNVSGGRDAWVLLRTAAGEWHELGHASATGRTLVADELRAAAVAAYEHLRDGPDGGEGAHRHGGHECFPMIVGGLVVGVFGVWVEGNPLSIEGRQRQAAAAALLAIGAKNVDMVREIREHSLRDALTGCCNRAHAIETLHVELRRAQRSGSDVSVIMLDLDHFKRVNDRRGHLAGDAVLAQVGQVLRTTLRASDLKARYGGEEFLILLPDTGLAAARGVAETLRKTLEQTPLLIGEHTQHVTASMGVTSAASEELDETAVIARADAALYAAKRAGRNCVQVIEAAGASRADAEACAVALAHRRTRAPRPAHDTRAAAGVP
jgi:diguanylate cyclase (GGDEF)-like protein